MAAEQWYFLFNDADGSYNCHQKRPFPKHMNHEGVTQRRLTVDVDVLEDVTLTFYDEFDDGIVDAAPMLAPTKTEKGQQMLADEITKMVEDQTREVTRSPTQIGRFNTLVSLARKYMKPEAVDKILQDGKIDATEADQINAAMERKPT
jgi:hypothetical protein